MAAFVNVVVLHPVSRVRLDVGTVRLSDGSMHSWLPRDVLDSVGVRREVQCEFRRPDGAVFSREMRYALIEIQSRVTIEDVVVCEPDDEPVIGWRTLSGLNLRLDEGTGALIDRGPIPAASVALSFGSNSPSNIGA